MKTNFMKIQRKYKSVLSYFFMSLSVIFFMLETIYLQIKLLNNCNSHVKFAAFICKKHVPDDFEKI